MRSVGKSIPHDSARGHVTGEARYIDDLPPLTGELWVEIAGSPCARGAIESIDLTAAAKVPGVVALLTHEDIPGHNCFGAVICDEPLLAVDRVCYVGQPVVMIAAESRDAAREARRRVRIVVREEAPVLTIAEALGRDEFIGLTRRIARGDFVAAYAGAPNHLEGTMHIAGQEQFYFESQTSLAIPGEDGQLHVHSSTQNPTEGQHVIAGALGLSMHQVVIECKRMGGGFGGKETQAVIPSVAVALVAQKTRRPARVVYTKDDDMKVTGKRHQYEAHYRIGYDDEGRILAAKLDFYSNGGAFCDLSPSVLERTMLHAENAYFIPDIEINGRICRTNIPPATAFRGFGGPQGVATIENVMQEIAQRLGMDAYDVRRVNCYDGARNVTPYGQIIRENTLPRVLDELLCTSNYRARVSAVEEFNRSSRTHLRGIAMTPVKFGIAFTASFLNQGNALVNVYYDGTVQVSTGATEMGQGVNIKIAQIVADEFGLPIDRVIVRSTTTEKSINTSPTAASASTDLNGFAALDACRQIKVRMTEFAASLFADSGTGIRLAPEHVRFERGFVCDDRVPDMRFAFHDFTRLCRLARVNLGAQGFYATPGVDFNRETGRGHPFHYFTTGAAMSEVLIDRFTGELTVESVNLLMDIGRPINPGVDRGQVIGGFVQGMGWVTTELLVYNDKGALLSYSPTTYKIPGAGDIPRDFRVEFLNNDANRTNIYSSKAVGEPPLLLGISVWAAVKNALSFVSEGGTPELQLPATGEEILRCLEVIRRKRSPAAAGVGVPELEMQKRATDP